MITVDDVYYINLNERLDRRKNIESQLSKVSYFKNKIQRYSAIDGTKIHPKSVGNNILSKRAIGDILSDNISAWGLSITQGGLGLILSYLDLFNIASKSKNPIITFEDDIELTDNFEEVFLKILNELPDDFDLCYLGHCETQFEKIRYSDNLSTPKGQLCCLPGIIISPSGAVKLLNIIKNIDSQIDTVIYLNFNKLNVYVQNPKIINIPNKMDSNIQGNKNNVKKYKTQNYIFSTIAIGDYYNEQALKLSMDFKFFDQKFLVVTDQPNLYQNINNVITFKYPNKKYSYNDKRLCFEQGLKHADCVVYCDCDSRILYENVGETRMDFSTIISPGFHPSFSWGNINREDGGFISSRDINGRVKGYGQKCLDICSKLGFNFKDAEHWQEGFLILSKEDGKEQTFLYTWEKLANELDKFELENNAPRLGVGEGNLIGIAVATSKLTVHNSDMCNLLGEHVRYNADGKKIYGYLEQYPKKKRVEFVDYEKLITKKIDVNFQEKKIDLEVTIFDTKENFLILYFEWNKLNAVEFLDHEFIINNKTYHFESEKSNSFYIRKDSNIKIYHTYDWFGQKDIQEIIKL